MKTLKQFEKSQLEIEQMKTVKGGMWFKKLKKILNYWGCRKQSAGIVNGDQLEGDEV